uniref:Uncharacterized protein n=1 Tax=Romanomermis culicivorax TaxID=13658 RepID=A0A915JWW9_ROMCU
MFVDAELQLTELEKEVSHVPHLNDFKIAFILKYGVRYHEENFVFMLRLGALLFFEVCQIPIRQGIRFRFHSILVSMSGRKIMHFFVLRYSVFFVLYKRTGPEGACHGQTREYYDDPLVGSCTASPSA